MAVTARDIVCGVCKGPALPRIAYHRDGEGNMWRVPVYICADPKCLAERGAIRIGTVPVGGIPSVPPLPADRAAYAETPGGKTRGPNA